MNEDILRKIRSDFPDEEVEAVISLLKSVTLDHVMAQSQYNLDNTHHSILYLSKGNIKKIPNYVEAAQLDFRDVIMWAGDDKEAEIRAQKEQKAKSSRKR